MADLKLADAHGGVRNLPNTEVRRFTEKFNGEVPSGEPAVNFC